MEKTELKLTIGGQTNGRALFIGGSGSLYVARRYSIYRSDDDGQSWTLDCRVPCEGHKPLIARSSLGERLLKLHIQALQVLWDGARVAVARDGIYRAEAGEAHMRRTWTLTRGSRPINLSADGNRLLFGEYGGRQMNAVGVRIYRSEDGGRQFEPVYEFPKGDVHHIHNVVVDGYANSYWVLAGDHGRQSGIGALSKDLKHLDWVERGNQMVRAVNVLVRPDCLIYGSDSELEPNYIVRLDKKTGRCERMMPIEGSSLYAQDFGNIALISTCVEPSRVNRSSRCGLYGSVDDEKWSRLLSLRKDCWSARLFQLGSIVLPHILDQQPAIGMFSGQALTRRHNRVSLFQIA